MEPRPVVAAAIVDSLRNPTKLLAAARAYPEDLRGMFELPGGKVEPGEAFTGALVREIREELNAEIIIGPKLASPNMNGWPLPGGRKMHVWLVETTTFPQVGASHLHFEWCNRNSIFDISWLPADKEIIRALADALGWSQPQKCATVVPYG